MEKKRTIKIYIQGRKFPITIRDKETNIAKFLVEYANFVEQKVDGTFNGHHYMVRVSSITHIKLN